MSGRCWKCLEMAGMAENGLKWLEKTGNCWNGWKCLEWLKMAGHGLLCLEMTGIAGNYWALLKIIEMAESRWK